MKVILNKCYGGFHPSVEAYRLYAKKKGIEVYPYKMDHVFGLSRVRYKKADDCENNDYWVQYFTKDLGDNVEIGNDDYEKYALDLRDDYRDDLVLVEVVEELGDKASSKVSHLVVVEIPDGMEYVIDDYDGVETLHQKVREW